MAPASLSRAISRSGQTRGTGAAVGPEKRDGMGIERDGQRRHAGRVGPLPEPPDQPLMAPMNAVKIADRHESPAGPARENPRRSRS